MGISKCQLTIDVDDELLRRGVVETGRARKFGLRAMRHESREFQAAGGLAFLVLFVGDALVFEPGSLIALELVRGDRLLLRAVVDSELPGSAEVLCGARVFVLHAFEKADVVTRAWLLEQGVLEQRAKPRGNAYWARVRDSLMKHLVEREIRGPVSVAAFLRHMNARATDVDFVGQHDAVGAGQVLSAFCKAAPTRHRRQREEAFWAIGESGSSYPSAASLERLLKLAQRVGSVFGEDVLSQSPAALQTRLVELSRGARVPFPDLDQWSEFDEEVEG